MPWETKLSSCPGWIACFAHAGGFVCGIIDKVNDTHAVMRWDDFELRVPRYTYLVIRMPGGGDYLPSVGMLIGKWFASEAEFQRAADAHRRDWP